MKRFYNKNHLCRDDAVTTIIDPSAASFITALLRENEFSVLRADNDVANGLRNTATALSQGYVKISDALENWKTEASGYIWDSTSGEDRPVKENDHLMDSTRYQIQTLRLYEPYEEYRGAFA